MTTVSVSVIIPTHQRAHLVGRAIAAALDQSLSPLEVLVVDDGSTDGTDAVVSQIRDRRVLLIRRAENRGAPEARNVGIEAARGDYVAFLDSDDEWRSDKLELQVRLFENSSVDDLGLVYCAGRIVEEGRERGGHGAELRGQIFRDLLELRRGYTASSFLVARSVLESGIRFDDSLSAWQDWDFMLAVASRFGVDAVPEPLVTQHRSDREPHIWQGDAIRTGTLQVLHKHRAVLPPAAVARAHRRLVRHHGARGEMILAAGHLLRALRADPLGSLRSAVKREVISEALGLSSTRRP